MLKLKDKKRSKFSLALLCALVLTTSCGKKEEVPIVDKSENPIEYENENSTSIPSILNDFSISSNSIDETLASSDTEEKIDYYADGNYISISKAVYGNYNAFSDEEYQKINKLLENEDINTLIISDLGDEVDFTRFNLDNINCLFLQNIKPSFKYEALSNKSYQILDITPDLLSDEAVDSLVDFINSITLEDNAVVHLNFDNSETQAHEQKIIDAISNCKNISYLSIYTNYFSILNLSNLTPNNLAIYTDMMKESTDLDVNLNESVSEFTIEYCFPDLDITPVIKSIKVNSANNNILIQVFIYSWDNKVKGTIDSNVDIKVPKSASINIYGINTNILELEALKQFQDMESIYITDSGLESNVSFIYKKNDGPFIEAVLIFDNARHKSKKRLLLN